MRSILVAVPAVGFLVPLFLLLLIQAKSVSAAERSYEGKVREAERGAGIQGCGWSTWASGPLPLTLLVHRPVPNRLTSLEGASVALLDLDTPPSSAARGSPSLPGALHPGPTVC